MNSPKPLCTCGHPQSSPVRHEHDYGSREEYLEAEWIVCIDKLKAERAAHQEELDEFYNRYKTQESFTNHHLKRANDAIKRAEAAEKEVELLKGDLKLVAQEFPECTKERHLELFKRAEAAEKDLEGCRELCKLNKDSYEENVARIKKDSMYLDKAIEKLQGVLHREEWHITNANLHEFEEALDFLDQMVLALAGRKEGE